MNKNIWKKILLGAIIASIIVASVYVYAGFQLRKAVAEGTIGVAKFMAQDRSEKITIYNSDSVEAILDAPYFSLFIDEYQNNDTFYIKVFKSQAESLPDIED